MITTEDYVQHDATALAALVARGDCRADELSEAAERQIERLNPQLNAVLQRLAPQAADAGGVFAGVPFLVKELVLHAAGVRCDMGSALTQGFVAPGDTELMQRFRRAGLRLIGTTQTPELGYGATTEPRLYGPARNPWNLAHSTGGSSGGSAAAVAAGLVPLAHANDGGGSIRIPASCCGLVGLKPTRDRVPTGPDYADPLSGMGVEFALTRSVRDCAGLLDAVHGADPGAPGLLPSPAQPYATLGERPPQRLRIAYSSRKPGGGDVDPACAQAVEQTALLLQALGHEVAEAAPDYDWTMFLEAQHIHWTSFVASVVDSVAPLVGKAADADTLEAATLACWDYGRRLSANQLQWAYAVNNIVSRAVGQFFTRYDVLLTPTLAREPAPLGVLDQNRAGISAHEWTQQIFDYAAFTPLFNMTGQPALSLPLHWSAKGLPVGVQLAAGFAREDLLLGLAFQLEAAQPWQARQLARMRALLA